MIAETKSQVDWEETFRAEEPGLRRLVASRLGGQDAVDDVMQEVAVVALTGKSRPTDEERAPGWLRGVAIFKVRDFWRRKQRTSRLREAISSLPEPENPERSPYEWVVAHERQSRVRAGLSELDAEDAKLVRMKYVDDLTYQQMANRLGVTVKTVEYRLLCARKRLRKALRKTQMGVL